jgi:hypothetical protein
LPETAIRHFKISIARNEKINVPIIIAWNGNLAFLRQQHNGDINITNDHNKGSMV